MSDRIDPVAEQEHVLDISMLPADLQRDAPVLTVNRIGQTENAYMRTECYLGYVEPERTYSLGFDGMKPADDMQVKDLPQSIKPPLTILTGQWISEVDLTIEDANILGGNGRYLLEEGETELQIAVAETTPEHLAYYGSHLVKVGEAVKFTSTGNLPLTITAVGEDYPDGYLLDPEKGGGAYLEVHDRPHFHMPMNEECGGYLIIGKRQESGVNEVSAFKIPYGYGVHMAPWAIHADAYLQGPYMVIYSATPRFSTVIVRKQDGELAKISFK
ncbi:hypothetical protein [Curvivirga sp.]|uniref:hypothetical protein n=1 Tax=Curvivirga sp. TaxID=2856848 RepID=UPI003B5A1664